MRDQKDTDSSNSFVEYIHRLTSALSRRPARSSSFSSHDRENQPPVPTVTDEKLNQSWSDHALHLESSALAADALAEIKHRKETILYLAYGSNLCHKTFQGRRGIRPLAQVNVVVPELKLTFDLPGIPYSEPCFANTARRDPSESPSESLSEPPPESMPESPDVAPSKTNSHLSASEKDPLLPMNGAPNSHKPKRDYHKDRWHKGLVGVVYEVTPMDYAHIIATEGGGSSYTDILVTCFVLPPSSTVPAHPDGKSFRAHTLFSPASKKPRNAPANFSGLQPYEVDPASTSANNNQDTTNTSTNQTPVPPTPKSRLHRPDTSYAQPSARYLGLLTTGAAEHSLPAEYRSYLQQIRPYRKTTRPQLVGAFIFMAIWGPVVASLFAMIALFQNEKGRSPPWLTRYSAAVFGAVWKSYDVAFRPVFGEGERTVEDGLDADVAADDDSDDAVRGGEEGGTGGFGVGMGVDGSASEKKMKGIGLANGIGNGNGNGTFA